MRISDWSSDVCSSDLPERARLRALRLNMGKTHGIRLRRSPPIRAPKKAGRKLASAAAAIPGSLRILFDTDVRGSVADAVSGGERSPCSATIGGGRSEEHTSELQSRMRISYAVFCW